MRICFIFFVLVLASCATTNPTVPTLKITDTPVIELLPRPLPITPRDIEWYVYGETNKDHAINHLQSKPLVCLTAKGYESLSLNVADLEQYITELMARVAAYEKLLIEMKLVAHEVKP